MSLPMGVGWDSDCLGEPIQGRSPPPQPPCFSVPRIGLAACSGSQLSPLSTSAPNKCELNCIPKGENFYFKHREAVEDGTPCEPGTRDVCVDGSCRVSPPTWGLAWGLFHRVSLPCTSRAGGSHQLDVFSRPALRCLCITDALRPSSLCPLETGTAVGATLWVASHRNPANWQRGRKPLRDGLAGCRDRTVSSPLGFTLLWVRTGIL